MHAVVDNPNASPPPAPAGPRLRRPHDQGPRRRAPGPRGIPWIGSLPEISRHGMLPFMTALAETHGDVFRYRVGGMRNLVVACPDGVERVLAGNRENYVKGKVYNGVREILGDGLVTLEGEPWRRRRRLAQPSFHRAALKTLIDQMAHGVDAFFADLEKRYPDGGRIDMHREMTTLTLDVVVEALFGRGLSAVAQVPYEVLADALGGISERANGVPVPRFLPTPGNLRLRRILSTLDGAMGRLIAAGRENPAAVEGTLLGMLLDARDEDTGAALTARELRDELLTLFIAGHETTALTMTWALVLLDAHPAWQDAIRTEAAQVLGTTSPTFETLGQLTVTRRVIDEVLRLRGPVAMVARNAVKADRILGFDVEPGDTVIPFFWRLHRHPEHWDAPETFDPDRFLPERQKARDPWAYVPFSAGQRVCIGNSFSLAESALILATWMRRADLRLAPGPAISPVMIATVRPSGPVWADLRWRERQRTR